MSGRKWLQALVVGLCVASVAVPSLAKKSKKSDEAMEMVNKANAQVESLEAKLATMEQRLAALEGKVKSMENAGQNAAQREQQATQLLQRASTLAAQGNFDQAKKEVANLNRSFAGTRAQSRGARLSQELAVIGKSAPADYPIEKWFQGESDVDFDGDKPTLIVFWEHWCPHCKREVPKIQQTYEKYGDQLQVVGLTKLTKNITEEQVSQFITDRNVSYPMAKETGMLSQHFGVRGIPAAAMVKDGKVVWRGHPVNLNENLLKKLIDG